MSSITQPDPTAVAKRTQHKCRFCESEKLHTVVDLGMSPLCQSIVPAEKLNDMEPFYPLEALVCEDCYLVQVPQLVSGEAIFGGEYAYFSSYSDAWLKHAKDYVDMITQRLNLDETTQVVELASNDGYLLKNFVERNIPCLGIEPADNVAAAAMQIGVPTQVKFFGQQTARELVEEGIQARLLLGNNVLAHVPDLNDFVAGMKILLAKDGVVTVEFPHLLQLMELNQFDTIYQEHYCYFSFLVVQKVFAHHGITLFDVEELWTHGGSLRIYGRHTEAAAPAVTPAVHEMVQREKDGGYDTLARYASFSDQVKETKHKLLDFLIKAKRDGKQVVAYGAPGKGVTLLNYCGVRTDFIDYTVDRNPYKQGKYLPGTRIPVHAPDRIAETKPDYVLILPWNLKDEITQQLAYIREWGGQCVVPIPEVTKC